MPVNVFAKLNNYYPRKILVNVYTIISLYYHILIIAVQHGEVVQDKFEYNP